MGERLKKGYYIDKRLFLTDAKRIFTNCRFYNTPDTEYFKAANTLEKFFTQKCKEEGI